MRYSAMFTVTSDNPEAAELWNKQLGEAAQKIADELGLSLNDTSFHEDWLAAAQIENEGFPIADNGSITQGPPGGDPDNLIFDKKG